MINHYHKNLPKFNAFWAQIVYIVSQAVPCNRALCFFVVEIVVNSYLDAIIFLCENKLRDWNNKIDMYSRLSFSVKSSSKINTIDLTLYWICFRNFFHFFSYLLWRTVLVIFWRSSWSSTPSSPTRSGDSPSRPR